MFYNVNEIRFTNRKLVLFYDAITVTIIIAVNDFK